MKTILLDLNSKHDLLLDVQKNTVSFASSDSAQRFCLGLLEGGNPWPVPEDASLSLWYSGPSGSGSYTEVDGASAFSVAGNTVTITPAPQMLAAPGSGLMCLMVHTADGAQRKMWNLVYTVEGVPGAEGTHAQAYFAAFSGLIQQAQAFIHRQLPDPSLTVEGKAADAAATGAALGEKAPVGLISATHYVTSLSALEEQLEREFAAMEPYAVKLLQADLTSGTDAVTGGYWFISLAKRNDNIGHVKMENTVGGTVCCSIQNGSFGPWEWVCPPTIVGREYRTTQRWKGKPVYSWLIDVGQLPNASTKSLVFSSAATVEDVICCTGSTNFGMHLPYITASGETSVYVGTGKGYVTVTTGADRSSATATILVQYTKTTDT